MDQQRRSIEREIQQTTQSLRGKIEKLEDQARHVVGTVTDGVRQTTETISKTADALSLKAQMQKRPGTVVAAAVGAGLLAGLRFTRRQAPAAAAAVARPTLGRAIAAGVASQAAGILLPMAAGLAASVVGEWAKKKYPGSSPYVNAVQTALGAKPATSEPLPEKAEQTV